LRRRRSETDVRVAKTTNADGFVDSLKGTGTLNGHLHSDAQVTAPDERHEEACCSPADARERLKEHEQVRRVLPEPLHSPLRHALSLDCLYVVEA